MIILMIHAYVMKMPKARAFLICLWARFPRRLGRSKLHIAVRNWTYEELRICVASFGRICSISQSNISMCLLPIQVENIDGVPGKYYLLFNVYVFLYRFCEKNMRKIKLRIFLAKSTAVYDLLDVHFKINTIQNKNNIMNYWHKIRLM